MIISNEWIAYMYCWRCVSRKKTWIFSSLPCSQEKIIVFFCPKAPHETTKKTKKSKNLIFSWDVNIFPDCKEPALPNFPGDFLNVKWWFRAGTHGMEPRCHQTSSHRWEASNADPKQEKTTVPVLVTSTIFTKTQSSSSIFKFQGVHPWKLRWLAGKSPNFK